MLLNIFQNIFNGEVVHALFLMFVHSLWTGAVMALLAGIIIMLTKRSMPLLRYRLLTGLLLFFIASMCYIFYDALYNNTSLAATGDTNKISTGTKNVAGQVISTGHQEEDIIQNVISFFSVHAATIVWIWFMVMLFKCLQLLVGVRGLHLLKNKNISHAGEYWNERMRGLAAKIRVSKPVALLQSSCAKVPMVIGHFKPVILFPAGILTSLPPNEIEAILLHELAHIRRKDFLMNALQHFAEIFFFFNPAVLWVSALIRNERENCCDDIAISVTHDKKQFIHALVSFQEYNAGIAAYSTTFPGAKNHLLNRVKRIITNNNKTLNNMEKILLVSGIVITCMVTTATFSQKQTTDKKETNKTKQAIKPVAAMDTIVPVTEAIAAVPAIELKQPADLAKEIPALPPTPKIAEIPAIDEIPAYIADTIPAENKKGSSHTNYNTTIDGKNYRLVEEDNVIKEFYIDGKRIPDDQLDSYKPVIDKIHQQMKESMEKLGVQAELLKKQQEVMQKQAEIMKKNTEQMQEQSKKMQETMQKQTEIMKQKAEQMQAQSPKMKEDIKQQTEIMKKQQNEMQVQAELMKKNVLQMKEQTLKMQQDFKMQQEQLQLKQQEFMKKVQEMKLQQEKMNKMMLDSLKQSRIDLKQSTFNIKPVYAVNSSIHLQPNYTTTAIIEDLTAAKLISDKKNLSFRLTNDELIINGIKQTDEIHNQILKKYVKKPGDNITLNYNYRNIQ